ncbi:MAG: VTT domain-containing protein [Propionibacteriaceae bacterium]|nr:VTT domain-containing protein [Propionibacteriaceae bacterium]
MVLVVWTATSSMLAAVSVAHSSEPENTVSNDAVALPLNEEPATRIDSETIGVSESVADAADSATMQREWWDDPGMPWKHQPGKSDIACMVWIGVVAVFGLVMLPLRGWLLGRSVPVMLAVMGSRTSAAGLGSLVRVGDFSATLWILPMLAGVVMANKFDWVYWWAGRLWGRGMIEVWAGRSARAARNYARAERWARKWGAVGIFIAYVPVPLPLMSVVFVLAGASGMKVKRFLLLDCLSCFVWLLLHFVLGYAIGEPAVFVLQQYAKYANYVAIALIVFVLGSAVLSTVRKAQTV